MFGRRGSYDLHPTIQSEARWMTMMMVTKTTYFLFKILLFLYKRKTNILFKFRFPKKHYFSRNFAFLFVPSFFSFVFIYLTFVISENYWSSSDIFFEKLACTYLY
jgi:hypothetical protein